MADYISKNEVLNLIMHNDKVCHYADERYENVVYATACRISDVVANMPAADVQSVKHGKWITNEELYYNGMVKCSCCNDEFYVEDIKNLQGDLQTINYCPNCGARMDGDTNG